MRFMAQRLPTGEMLSTDLPLTGGSTSVELSGPGGVFGMVDAELASAKAADGRPILDEWATALYATDDSGANIIAGGIVQTVGTQGASRIVTAPGFANYPQGQPYLDPYVPPDWEDPTMVFKKLWDYLQSFPNANLGVQVVRPNTYMILGDGAGPWNMPAYEYRDIGGELDAITTAANFDWVETHAWANSGRTALAHQVRISFPRAGSVRTDLRFVQDENVLDVGEVSGRGENYCSDLLYLGLGEGYTQARDRITDTTGNRLRRAAVTVDRRATPGRVSGYAAREFRARQLGSEVTDITIATAHPNAPLGAIQLGDDITLDYDLPHLGPESLNLRVIAIEEEAAAPGIATLKVARSDLFVYSDPTSPNGNDPFLVTV